MHILGINIYHPDSAAAIIKDGQLIAAVEEERFKRIKHWSGFPVESVKYCLGEARIELKGIDYIGISRNPYAHLYQKIYFALKKRFKFSLIRSRLENMSRIANIRKIFSSKFSLAPVEWKVKIYNIEHHCAHLASSFFVSGFEEAAVLSLDAMGDFISTMSGYGKANHIKIIDRIFFPHSLGYLYTAATQFLGFQNFGEEYKVMGLAAYGEPRYLGKFTEIIRLKPGGGFELNIKYFNFNSHGLNMTWDEKAPVCGNLYSGRWIKLFGRPRNPHEKLTQHHKDIAASLQGILEETYFHILNYLYKKTHMENLCLAGGVALNCVANGKIFEHTPFKELFIQPAAGDAGTSIGAAYYIYHEILNQPRNFLMQHAYWGPEFSNAEIERILNEYNLKFKKYNENELIKNIAQELASGLIVGWFQGRMEWGPRALGNRSILADPRKPEMKDILNARIKHRETFRPFAPSILEERIQDYFDSSRISPFMLISLPVKKEKLSSIIASVHIDATARYQTVSRQAHPLFWRLLNEFNNITGVPALLNTSFNENEPIVCSPREAIDCFLRTKMDVLVMDSYLISNEKNF